MSRLDRRSFVRGMGALGAAMLLPIPPSTGAAAGRAVHEVRLTALGLTGRVTLITPRGHQAEVVAAACRERLARVDHSLSLYRPDSAIRRLNRAGRLDDAPGDLCATLESALEVAHITAGAFDPSVQALWTLYSHAFAPERGAGEPPGEGELARVMRRIGHRGIHYEPQARRIALEQPGMTITLNGIAQGYAADALAETIRQAGIRDFLVEFGEFRASGSHVDGGAWRVGVAAPRRGRLVLIRVLALSDAALATSAGYGLRFDAQGRYHHLFHPATGTSANDHASVSVTAPTAAAADAFATAFAVMPLDDIRRVIRRRRHLSALVVGPEGSVRTL